MKRTISEFYSDPSTYSFNRIASISADDDSFVVDLYQDSFLIESRVIKGHTLEYARDCAEKWILGVIR